MHTTADRPSTPEQPDPHRYRARSPRAAAGPIDLRHLVPGAGPLEVDIGFGRGRSLFARIEADPAVRVLGLELKHKWVCKVEERLRREAIERVRVFAEDARGFLRRASPDGSVRRFFFHFPDPWWKKRHAKRRLLDADLLVDIERLLAPAGELFIQTDVLDRAEHYRSLVLQRPAFACVNGEPFVTVSPFPIASNRELRAVADGLPVYRILVRRAIPKYPG